MEIRSETAEQDGIGVPKKPEKLPGYMYEQVVR
jgi:hypothetical protein